MTNPLTEIRNTLLKGDLKSIPGTLVIKCLDDRQLEQMFVDAGAHIACYERDGSEESELRYVAFQEENMRMLAKHMRDSADDFSWMEDLHRCVKALLSGNAMTEENKRLCEQHFCEIMEAKLRGAFPEVYGRSRIDAIYGGVQALGQRIEGMEGNLQKALAQETWMLEWIRKLEEERMRPRQESSEHQEKNTEKADYSIPKWHLKHVHVEGIWKPKAEREQEIRSLIEAWSREREVYPGWYVAPHAVCEELSAKTSEMGLLQSHEWVDGRTMLLFAYELVWRYEKCFQPYSGYEFCQIQAIWENYAAAFREGRQETPQRSPQAGTQDAPQNDGVALSDTPDLQDLQKWFYVGQALLRVSREYGDLEKWKKIYGILHGCEKYGVNGSLELQLEKAKYEYYQLHIPGLRRELGKCRPQKDQYEQRLQLLGLRVECGEADAVIPELRLLIQDLKAALAEEMTEQHRIFCMTLSACALQLLSLCVQGVRDYREEYEAYQEEINRLLSAMEQHRALFDWDEWKSYVEAALLQWHTKKYEKSEAFGLKRETMVFFGGSSFCTASYRFYRVLERLALPLRCGYVNLIGNLEQPWMEALLEGYERLGLFAMVRGNRSNTIKELADREYITALDPDSAEDDVLYLMNALSVNVDEMDAMNQGMAGSLASRVQENVPELIIRFMSRCPENRQEKALLLLKQLMEDSELSVLFPMTAFIVGILDCVSEKKKAQMLGIMMGTEICEHKTMRGNGNGIDLFDYYFCKTDIGPLQGYCSVDPDVVEWLLHSPQEDAYAWRTRIVRLQTLDELGLLDEGQRQEYARLVWSRISADSGLPDLPNLHLFAYEKLPGIDAAIPMRSVKGYFLSQRLADQFEDHEGCKFSMGEIPYLDELILLCQNVEKGYWQEDEAEKLLKNILEYWNVLKEKYSRTAEDSSCREEYRRRAGTMARAAADVCGTLEAGVSGSLAEELLRMAEEMEQFHVGAKELEVRIRSDRELVARVGKDLRSPNRHMTVSALVAAFQYLSDHPSSQEARELLEAVPQILRYRKLTGLVSAVWVLHNLVYERNPIVNGDTLKAMDDCLQELGEVMQDRHGGCGWKTKDTINVCKACTALAYQMYRWKEADAGPGVLLWRKLAEECGVNEIRNEWVCSPKDSCKERFNMLSCI